jgi:hypothetical protein
MPGRDERRDFVAYLVLFEQAVQRTLVMASVLNSIHAGSGALSRTESLLENQGELSVILSRIFGDLNRINKCVI